MPQQLPGKFLGIVGEDLSDPKSNRLHVHIFRFCFHSYEVYSLDSSKIVRDRITDLFLAKKVVSYFLVCIIYQFVLLR